MLISPVAAMAKKTMAGLFAVVSTGLWLGPAPAQQPSPGDLAPPITIEHLSNAPRGTKADWAVFGDKTVVLEFWGTWCAPCVAAIPHLNDLHDALHGQGVEFLSVTYEDVALVDAFRQRRSMRSWIGHDTDRSMVASYGVRNWPTTFVVRAGKILARTHPTHLTQERLRRFVAEGKPDAVEAATRAANEVGVDGRPIIDAYQPGLDPYSRLQEEPIFQFILRKAGPSTAAGTNPAAHFATTRFGHDVSEIVACLWGVEEWKVDASGVSDDDRYDLIAWVPEASMMPMVRTLAESVLGVRVVATEEDRPGYELRIAQGGHKLKPGVGERAGWGTQGSAKGTQVTGASLEVRTLASILAGILRQPVEDATGLAGRYYVELSVPKGAADVGPALREQLGLDLVPTTVRQVMVRVSKDPVAAAGKLRE